MGWDPPFTFAPLTRRGTYLGVEAYIQILSLGSRAAWLGRLIASTPSSLSGGVYHWVATHRPFLSSLFGRGSHEAIPHDRYVAGGSNCRIGVTSGPLFRGFLNRVFR